LSSTFSSWLWDSSPGKDLRLLPYSSIIALFFFFTLPQKEVHEIHPVLCFCWIFESSIYILSLVLVSFELHSLQYMVPTKLHDVAMGLIHSIRLLAFIHSTNPQLWTWIYLCMLCL
jgi:hypothetical protein